MTRPNVVVLTNIPVHYRVPVFNALSRMSSIDFRVLYCAMSENDRDWDPPRDMAYQWKVVDAQPLYLGNRPVYASPKIFQEIARAKPNVLLTGGFSVPTGYCIAYRQFARQKVGLVFFGEATRHSERSASTL